MMALIQPQFHLILILNTYTFVCVKITGSITSFYGGLPLLSLTNAIHCLTEYCDFSDRF